MKVMKMAMDNKWEKVFVLEDDFLLLKDAYKQDFQLPLDADITYFGGMFWHLDKQPPPVDDNWIKIDPDRLKLVCTYSYSVNKQSVIKDIYNVCKSAFNDGKGYDKHPDWRRGEIKLRAQAMDFVYINHFQKNGTCYVINPVLFTHYEDLESNISAHIGSATGKWKHSYLYHPSQVKVLKQTLGEQRGGRSYQYIIDPKTYRIIDIRSNDAHEIMYKYINYLNTIN